jgi:hypothetical protein
MWPLWSDFTLRPRIVAVLAFALAACGAGVTAPPPPEITVGPEALQLSLAVSSTELRPADQLLATIYAANPSSFPSVARVDCLHYGLGLVLRLPTGAIQDVFTGIPPCKVPNLPPTLRIAPGAIDSIGVGWSNFAMGYPLGQYQLQVVYRTVTGTTSGPVVSLRFLAP